MTAPASPRRPLPHLRGTKFVTDGGMETDLIFHHGVELPAFAAFPLLETSPGRAMLQRYYDDYAAIATAAGAGLMLESPTWRANPDWGMRLGYSVPELTRINTAAIVFLTALRARYHNARYHNAIDEVVINGMIGPRGDGYSAAHCLTAQHAADYHRPQLEAFATAGADMATAYTLTDTGEAIGIVRAARSVGMPIAISFTVETDGRLPNGATIAQAIATVDAAAAPDYYLINCAHPGHVCSGLDEPGPWRERILGTRANASLKSHAELDDADDLDEGDIDALATAQAELTRQLPGLTIIGGCCGTDHRHVAALWRESDTRQRG